MFDDGAQEQGPLDQKLGRYINVAVLVSLIASVLTIYFFVGALNRNAEMTDRQLLNAGLESAAYHNETWAADYGWWSEARDLVELGNAGVLGETMASSFESHSGFDFVAIASSENEDVYGWHRDTGLKSRSGLIPPEDLDAARGDLASAYAEGDFIASHFMTLNGIPYIASITIPGSYEDRATETDPATDPVLIIGSEIDKPFFTALEDRFRVDEIDFSSELSDAADTLPLADDSGHVVGHLSWTPSQPGIATLRLTLIPLVLYIIAFFLVAQAMVLKARALARRAESNEKRAMEAAGTDTLSDLPNRLGFTRFIESETATREADSGRAAIIYIDLNGFKAVNDKSGHRSGDAVIREVADRFRGAVPAHIHIARVGGDEFACALVGESDAGRALDIARGLSAALKDPVEVDGKTFEIGAAIGVAWSRPEATKTFSQLVHDADLAMYRAKADQLDQPLCYDTSLGLEQSERHELEQDIQAGLDDGQFHVVYQPIVRSADGKLVSVEALLRWNHPDRGAVPPDVFIPVAERSKLIHQLGDFVLSRVCEDIGGNAGHGVSINLSPTQLGDPDLCRRYTEALDRHGMTPGQIEFELTEAVLVDDFERARSRLLELHEAGYRVNLDDFGTGFASMGYLHMLPFSKIKIDKSYVAMIGKGDGPNKMLQALALLGDALEVDIVAEGVETETQARMLALLGFEYQQGWHHGHPMGAEDLASRKRGAA